MTAQLQPVRLRPESELDTARAVRDAIDRGTRLRVIGGGTRDLYAEEATLMATSSLAGITLYEPSELVIGAWAGTPLRRINEELAAMGQVLAFEVPDYRRLLGTTGEPTIGGAFSFNACGPRRVVAGSLRDNALGMTLVNGRGELIRSGGRVMKNVTGLDLTRLAAGARGVLGIVTHVYLKVLPRPETSVSLRVPDVTPSEALALMAAALGGPHAVSGAAYLPESSVLLRLEGNEKSVRHRVESLALALGCPARCEVVDVVESESLWNAIRDVLPLADGLAADIWRIAIAARMAPSVLERIGSLGSYLVDWGGALIWIAVPRGEATTLLLSSIAAAGGHARCVRPSRGRRAEVITDTAATPVTMLERRVRAAFDPDGVFVG